MHARVKTVPHFTTFQRFFLKVRSALLEVLLHRTLQRETEKGGTLTETVCEKPGRCGDGREPDYHCSPGSEGGHGGMPTRDVLSLQEDESGLPAGLQHGQDLRTTATRSGK